MRLSPGKFYFVVSQSLFVTSVIGGLLLSSVASGQSLPARFHSNSPGASWSVSSSGVMTWRDEIYCPIGAAISGTPSAIQSAASAGISDVVVDLPLDGSDWNVTIAELEKAKIHYSIRLDGGSPATRGYLVDPAGNRVSGVSQAQRFDFDLPDANSAVVVAADRTDGSVVQWDRVLPKNDIVTIELKSATNESGRVLLLYPEGESYVQMDCWEGFDRFRDRLLAKLKATKFGPGFRGIINPVGAATPLPKDEPAVVPTSDFYRLELARFLDQKYRSLDTALRSWGVPASFNVLAPDSGAAGEFKSLTTFADVARLVPLWRNLRGVSQFYDPVSNRLIPADSRRSAAWSDISEVIRRASVARFARLTSSIRSVVDVPITQEWNGWSPVTESGDTMLTGMAVTAEGSSLSELIERGARASSTSLRWQPNGWLIASDIRLKADQWTQAAPVADDLLSMGMRAIFFRAESPESFKAIKTQRERLADHRFASEVTRALFFPENASEPAQAQRLPGGFWWLPSPASGNRIDLSDHYFAYRTETNGRSQLYLWTDQPGRVKLYVNKPDALAIRNVDGSDPDIKGVKGGVEVNLGLLPSVIEGTDELPIPAPALLETMANYKVITDRNKRLKRDVTEELSVFRAATAGMERNPSGSYPLLRQVLRSASLKIGDTSWIEAESARDNTCSDITTVGGTSGGSVLTLAPRLPNANGFYANYDVSVKYIGVQEVWIAARIPASVRSSVTITIGGQVLTLPEQPTAYYGQGFGWYRLGTTRMTGNIARLRLSVGKALRSDMAFDAIVITPEAFSPRGLNLPPVSPLPEASPGTGSGGR